MILVERYSFIKGPHHPAPLVWFGDLVFCSFCCLSAGWSNILACSEVSSCTLGLAGMHGDHHEFAAPGDGSWFLFGFQKGIPDLPVQPQLASNAKHSSQSVSLQVAAKMPSTSTPCVFIFAPQPPQICKLFRRGFYLQNQEGGWKSPSALDAHPCCDEILNRSVPPVVERTFLKATEKIAADCSCPRYTWQITCWILCRVGAGKGRAHIGYRFLLTIHCGI